MTAILGIATGDSVYEVGCGAGAFLYALRERSDIRVGGCDYAPALLDVARRAIPEDAFAVLDATQLPVVPAWDLVVSHSVFHYFPDLDHAALVLDRMLAKARRGVAIFEVPDLRQRDAAERIRRDTLPLDDYERLYAGLGHLYYDPDWFAGFAATHAAECRLVPSPLRDSAQAAYRFGAVLVKR